MLEVDFSRIWPELIGLVPVYSRDITNGTEIRLENRSPLYSPFRTKTLVRRLARLFTIDLRAARDRYGEVCGRSYAIPIPLRPGLVLVPVRARQARVKDDGTRAYVVKGKIAGFDRITAGGGRNPGCPPGKGGSGAGESRTRPEAELRTRLLFTDGSHLDVPHGIPGIRSLLLLAEKVEREADLTGGGEMPCRGLTGDTEVPCRGLPRIRPGHSLVSEKPPHDCIYRLWSLRPEKPE